METRSLLGGSATRACSAAAGLGRGGKGPGRKKRSSLTSQKAAHWEGQSAVGTLSLLNHTCLFLRESMRVMTPALVSFLL